MGVAELVATHGSRGVRVITAEREDEISSEPVRGRHAVGAGDVFLAAYLLLRARGRPALDAARGACRAAAHKVALGTVPRAEEPREARG